MKPLNNTNNPISACSQLASPESALDLPITYHRALKDDIDIWADCACVSVAELRQATEAAVRTCDSTAVVEWEGYRFDPDVYQLGLCHLKCYYTVEAERS